MRSRHRVRQSSQQRLLKNTHVSLSLHLERSYNELNIDIDKNMKEKPKDYLWIKF